MMKEVDLLKKVAAVMVSEKSIVLKCLPENSEVLMIIQTSLMRKTISMTTRNRKINPQLMNNEERRARVTETLKAA